MKTALFTPEWVWKHKNRVIECRSRARKMKGVALGFTVTTVIGFVVLSLGLAPVGIGPGSLIGLLIILPYTWILAVESSTDLSLAEDSLKFHLRLLKQERQFLENVLKSDPEYLATFDANLRLLEGPESSFPDEPLKSATLCIEDIAERS